MKRITSIAMSASVAGLIGVAALPAGAVQAAQPAVRFSKPIALKDARGGEPSIATDRTGNIYVSAPVGIPGGANQKNGVNFWYSRDHGKTWSDPENIGSYQGGGDSDLNVGPDGTIYVADLNATSSTICTSTDHGMTFQDANPGGAPSATACTTVATSQYGYSSDRQWMNVANDGSLYLTYHEFTSAQPVIFRDDAGGADAFSDGPCGPIVSDPAIEPNVLNDITAGSLVSKPVLDEHGNIYILFTAPTQPEQADAVQNQRVSPTFSQAYMAVSTDKCLHFTDYTIYDGVAKHGINTVQFGDDFNVLAIDGSGVLYAVAAGFIGDKKFDTVANMYYFDSTDGGKTWSDPVMLDKPDAAHMLPAIVAGQHRGEVAIGYYRTINGKTDPNDGDSKWTYSIAESVDGARATPHWTYVDPNPGVSYHDADICNSGTLCGTKAPGTGNDRSLADFSQATLDSGDCPVFAFAGNPSFNPPMSASNSKPQVLPFFTAQQSPCFASGTSASGSFSSVSGPLGGGTNVAPASAAQDAPLPNSAAAPAGRGLLAGGFLALFVIAFAARVLTAPRRSH